MIDELMLCWLWWLLTMACVVWYCTITVYVAIKGSADIKEMLARLSSSPEESSDAGRDGYATDR